MALGCAPAGASNLQDSQRLCVHLMDRALDRLEASNGSGDGPAVQTVLGIFDLRGFTSANADWGFVRFLVDIFFLYYPKVGLPAGARHLSSQPAGRRPTAPMSPCTAQGLAQQAAHPRAGGARGLGCLGGLRACRGTFPAPAPPQAARPWAGKPAQGTLLAASWQGQPALPEGG